MLAKKYTFIRTLQFYARDEDEAWEKLAEFLDEEGSEYAKMGNSADCWALDPFDEDEEEEI